MTTGMVALADEAATVALGGLLADLLRPGDVVALSGALGAGKTTLARAVLQALGLEGEAPSPTFPTAGTTSASCGARRATMNARSRLMPKR